MKSKTKEVIGVSLVSLIFGAIMMALFLYASMKSTTKMAVESLNGEVRALNMYEDLQNKHIDLQIEYLNMLEEYSTFIYINSGQAEADSIYQSL